MVSDLIQGSPVEEISLYQKVISRHQREGASLYRLVTNNALENRSTKPVPEKKILRSKYHAAFKIGAIINAVFQIRIVPKE